MDGMKTLTSKQISAAFDKIGMGYAKNFGNVYNTIKSGRKGIKSAFGTLCAGNSDRTSLQTAFLREVGL